MSLVGKVMVFKGGSFSGHKRDFAAALAMAQFGVNLETSVTRATHMANSYLCYLGICVIIPS